MIDSLPHTTLKLRLVVILKSSRDLNGSEQDGDCDDTFFVNFPGVYSITGCTVV